LKHLGYRAPTRQQHSNSTAATSELANPRAAPAFSRSSGRQGRYAQRHAPRQACLGLSTGHNGEPAYSTLPRTPSAAQHDGRRTVAGRRAFIPGKPAAAHQEPDIDQSRILNLSSHCRRSLTRYATPWKIPGAEARARARNFQHLQNELAEEYCTRKCLHRVDPILSEADLRSAIALELTGISSASSRPGVCLRRPVGAVGPSGLCLGSRSVDCS
jgi:hypothetical protein